MTLDYAIDIFTRGFAFGKSFTHPYLVEMVGEICRMHDGPRKSGQSRTEEFVVNAHRTGPNEAKDKILSVKPGRLAVAVMHDDSIDREEVKRKYKALGLRALGTEPFFVCNLEETQRHEGPLPIRRIRSKNDADAVAKAAGNRQILDELLPGEKLRLYAAFEGERPVGWVRSVQVDSESTWVSNMFVQPSRRRKGIGKSLMSAMLAEDRLLGAAHSVLLASTLGATLYPLLGYRQIGLLQLFTPTVAFSATS